ncbi:MAG: hypothetical protein M1548_02775 [Actinobacteria bacterium]|nr:hypothetical protein [Actinomycetota bacterium]
MKAIAVKSSRQSTLSLILLAIAVLVVGLVSAPAIRTVERRKSNSSGPVAKEIAKTPISSLPSVPEGIVLGETSGGAAYPKEKRVIPYSNILTLEEARKDPKIKFLTPKKLPDGSKLVLVFRVPNETQTIAQRYTINGKYLEISAIPQKQTPDYKKMADEGLVFTPEQNADGSIKRQSDGGSKMVRRDQLKYITVNGLPGAAHEPTEVKGIGGGTIHNPGTLGWFVSGTEYHLTGEEMNTQALLKIARSMSD